MRAVRALHNVSQGDAQKGEDDGERERPTGVTLHRSCTARRRAEKSKIKIRISKKINQSNNIIEKERERIRQIMRIINVINTLV